LRCNNRLGKSFSASTQLIVAPIPGVNWTKRLEITSNKIVLGSGHQKLKITLNPQKNWSPSLSGPWPAKQQISAFTNKSHAKI
jgi:hypothetical protein